MKQMSVWLPYPGRLVVQSTNQLPDMIRIDSKNHCRVSNVHSSIQMQLQHEKKATQETKQNIARILVFHIFTYFISAIKFHIEFNRRKNHLLHTQKIYKYQMPFQSYVVHATINLKTIK